MEKIVKERFILIVIGYLFLGAGLAFKKYYPMSAAGSISHLLALLIFIKSMFLFKGSGK